MSRARGGPVTRLIDRVGRAGPVGRELAVRLDTVRSVSPGHAWRRTRWDAEGAHERRVVTDMAPAYRAIWLDAAQELGAEVTERPEGFLELRAHGAWTRVWRQWVMLDDEVGSSRVDLQACKLEYSIVSPK